jgi:hypothetical protein
VYFCLSNKILSLKPNLGAKTHKNMREIIDDTIYDDEFLPIEMLITEGFQNDVPTTFYQIALEAGFDDQVDEILLNSGLDTSGYVLECIMVKFLEQEHPNLLPHIIGTDSESATFVVYADSEENQRAIAAILQVFCSDLDKFGKVTKANIGYVKEQTGEA